MMKIYPDEVKNGLAEVIQASAKINFASTPYMDVKPSSIIFASLDLMKNIGEQKDLAPFQSILVSTGWNANRDIFTNREAWAARNTPVNKQVNLGHTADIVGHMVSSSVVDFNGVLIPDDTKFENLPNDFDIIAAAVLYKKHPNEDLRAEIAELIPKIANGEAHVSMECFFNDFDYGLMKDDEQMIVARNEDTAWLTKHLWQFGGHGEYNGYTLGRVIKNLTFSGKGIVDNPANKRSIIFSEMKSFSSRDIKLDTSFISVSEKIKKEKKMSEENTVSKEAYDKVVAELEKIRQGEVAQLQEKVETYDEVVAKLNTEIEELQDKIAEAEENSEKYANEAKASKENADTKLAELEALHKELDEIKAKSLRTERISKLITAGVAETEAGEIADEWSAANDEQFNKIVAMQKEVIEAKANIKTEPEELEEESEAEASTIESENEVPPVVNEEQNEFDVAASISFLSTLSK